MLPDTGADFRRVRGAPKVTAQEQVALTLARDQIRLMGEVVQRGPVDRPMGQ